MRRPTEDDTLEPILPKHPPVAREEPPPGEAAVAEASTRGDGAALRPAWERRVLLGCAVVATLAAVICALRLSSIAEDQRLQACQARVYVEEQLDSSSSRFDPGSNGFRERLAACIGVDPDEED